MLLRERACQLYDGLAIHSLGEGTLFDATWAHLGRPCIAGARELLEFLAEAADIDMTALGRSKPALMQRLDCLAAPVQDEVAPRTATGAARVFPDRE